jgi:hypothetical protein
MTPHQIDSAHPVRDLTKSVYIFEGEQTSFFVCDSARREIGSLT